MLLFCHHSHQIGGAEKSLIDLIANLDQHQYPSIAAVPSGQFSELLKRQNIHVINLNICEIRNTLNPFYILSIIWRLLIVNIQLFRLIRTHSVKLVHANSATSCLHCFAASYLRGVPLIWHERDLGRHPKLYNFLSRFTAKIIAISNSVEVHLQKQFSNRSKVLTIHNGIDATKFSQSEPHQQIDLPRDKKIILMAAQFVPWKHHDILVKALPEIRTKHPDCCVVFAGCEDKQSSADYIKELKLLIAEMNLTKHVIFTGFHENMNSLYQQAYCVAHPAVREPFGRVIAEAMLCQKAVVAFNSCGPSEIIHNGTNGILVDLADAHCNQPTETDIANFAKAITDLLSDSGKAKELGQKAHEHILQNFTIEQTVDKFTKLVDQLI